MNEVRAWAVQTPPVGTALQAEEHKQRPRGSEKQQEASEAAAEGARKKDGPRGRTRTPKPGHTRPWWGLWFHPRAWEVMGL